MSSDSKQELDRIARRVLRELQADARLSLAEIGRRVGLTPPAVAERMRRLEELGVIRGYHADINPASLGLPLLIFIRLTTTAQYYPEIIGLLRSLPEIIECHHVAGGDSFVIKARASSVEHVETLIGQISPFGTTTTSIVLSSPVDRTILDLDDSEA